MDCDWNIAPRRRERKQRDDLTAIGISNPSIFIERRRIFSQVWRRRVKNVMGEMKRHASTRDTEIYNGDGTQSRLNQQNGSRHEHVPPLDMKGIDCTNYLLSN